MLETRIILDRRKRGENTIEFRRMFVLLDDGSWDLFECPFPGRAVLINNVTTDHMLALVKEHSELNP